MYNKKLTKFILFGSLCFGVSGYAEIFENVTTQAKEYALSKVKNQDSYFNVSVGTWYMSWEQNDHQDNSDIQADKTIEHTYKIDDSFATEISLNGRWGFVSGHLDFITSKKVEDKVNKYVGDLSFDTSYLDTYMRYIHTKTDGMAYGYDNDTQNESNIAFETALDIFDLILYPNINGFKYLGLGYRYVDYELPQTIYIQNGTTTVSRQVDPEMQWEGNFVTLSFDMSRIVLDEIYQGEKKWGWYINLLGGYGFDITPSSKTVSSAGYSSYLNGDSGYFYEADIGVAWNFYKIGHFGNLLGKVGYRYDKFILETEKEKDGVYIYAKAQSEFYGPYINVSLQF